MRSLLWTLVTCGLLSLAASGGEGPGSREPEAVLPKPAVSWTDVHCHINGLVRGPRGPQNQWAEAVAAAVRRMDQGNVAVAVIMPPPFLPENRASYDVTELLDATAKYPGRFRVMAGGGSLNPLISDAVKSGETTETAKLAFRKTALGLLDKGAAGFGEFAVLHFCLGPTHNCQVVPPDHPLLLLLADIAAERDVPIDIHMDVVSKAMPLPDHLRVPPNPERLQPNLEAFERLLAHNRKARIIWSHAGWDNTGGRSLELMSRLLTDHPNLYMSIKLSPIDSLPAGMPVEQGRGIRPEWLAFLQKHGDRMLMGCDQFFVPQGGQRIGPESFEPTVRFFSELPVALQKKVGVETPAKVFRKDKP